MSECQYKITKEQPRKIAEICRQHTCEVSDSKSLCKTTAIFQIQNIRVGILNSSTNQVLEQVCLFFWEASGFIGGSIGLFREFWIFDKLFDMTYDDLYNYNEFKNYPDAHNHKLLQSYYMK